MEELDRMLRDLDVELEKLRSFELPENYQEVKFIDEEQMEIKFQRRHPLAIIPTKASDLAGGWASKG